MRLSSRLLKIINPSNNNNLPSHRNNLRNMPSSDLLTLRFLCKNIYLKVPSPRCTNITLSYGDIGLSEVDTLARIPPAQRGAFEHLILNFTLPGLYLLQQWELDRVVRGYSPHVRGSIWEFCRNYEENGNSVSTSDVTASETTPATAVVKITKNTLKKLVGKINTQREENNSTPQL